MAAPTFTQPPRLLWVVLPFAALFVLLAFAAAGGLWVVAREADRSDAARAQATVRHAFTGFVGRVEDAVVVNAVSTPLAELVHEGTLSSAALRPYTHYPRPGVFGSFGTLLLRPDGSVASAHYLGKAWRGPPAEQAAMLVRKIAARLPTQGAGSGRAMLMGADGQAVVVAVTNITPDPSAPRPDLLRRPAWRLAMLHPAVELLPKVNIGLGANVRMAPRADGASTVSYPVEGGPPIYLTWDERRPGAAAIRRWWPAMAAVLLLATLLLAWAMARALKAARALRALAETDMLTGLPNRAAFTAALERAASCGCAVGLIDLDGFKAVNDSHGHLAGDELLRAVARVLSESLPAGGMAARLGGDEFAFLMPSLVAADRFAATIGERLGRPVQAGALRLSVGASVGVAEAAPGTAPRAALALADARMYRAKADAKGEGSRARLHAVG